MLELGCEADLPDIGNIEVSGDNFTMTDKEIICEAQAAIWHFFIRYGVEESKI